MHVNLMAIYMPCHVIFDGYLSEHEDIPPQHSAQLVSATLLHYYTKLTALLCYVPGRTTKFDGDL
jgi:hypothetical protein